MPSDVQKMSEFSGVFELNYEDSAKRQFRQVFEFNCEKDRSRALTDAREHYQLTIQEIMNFVE